MRPHTPSQQRITIRLRGSHARAPQGAARAANVLNDHLLAERPAHTLCHNTRDDVTRPACWEWHNHSDGSAWVALRMRSEWHNAKSNRRH